MGSFIKQRGFFLEGLNQTEKCASVPRKSEQPGGHARALPLWEGKRPGGSTQIGLETQKPSDVVCGFQSS